MPPEALQHTARLKLNQLIRVSRCGARESLLRCRSWFSSSGCGVQGLRIGTKSFGLCVEGLVAPCLGFPGLEGLPPPGFMLKVFPLSRMLRAVLQATQLGAMFCLQLLSPTDADSCTAAAPSP